MPKLGHSISCSNSGFLILIFLTSWLYLLLVLSTSVFICDTIGVPEDKSHTSSMSFLISSFNLTIKLSSCFTCAFKYLLMCNHKSGSSEVAHPLLLFVSCCYLIPGDIWLHVLLTIFEGIIMARDFLSLGPTRYGRITWIFCSLIPIRHVSHVYKQLVFYNQCESATSFYILGL